MRRTTTLVALGVVALGCSVRRAPQPLHLDAAALDGHTVDAASLVGKPQVIALWLPG